MMWRVVAEGYSAVYTPLAVVRHEHRREMACAYRQILGHQQALIAFLVKTFSRERAGRRVGVLTYLIWRLTKPGLRVLASLVGRDPLPTGLLMRMWLGCWQALTAYSRASAVARAKEEVGA
jgi:hypothetical protein